MASKPAETRHHDVPNDGTVLVTVESDVTEQEIVEDRDSIVETLHSAYLNLLDEMKEFQEQWDSNPKLAFITSAGEGLYEGGADWLKDQAELFEAKTWKDIGGKVSSAASAAYDRLGIYSKQQYQTLQKEVNKSTDHPEDTLYNWAWWQATIEEKAGEVVKQHIHAYESLKKTVEDARKTVLNTADKASKIYKHRNAILNLPELIANGEPKPIQAFIDHELMDIDPELAKGIRDNPNFYLVLEVIADHDSALTFLSYAGLMIEAIPPNFYAYLSGKGGAYLLIEVILLVVTAILSAGAAAASRIAMLVARIATSSAKVAGIGKKIQRAKAAIAAFVRIIEDFSEAANDLHALGAKLVRARNKGIHIKKETRMTMKAKKESMKREKKCRWCQSTHHDTPRAHKGKVVYE